MSELHTKSATSILPPGRKLPSVASRHRSTRSHVPPLSPQAHTSWGKASPSTHVSSSAATYPWGKSWRRSLVVSLQSANSDPGPTSQTAAAAPPDGAGVLGAPPSAAIAGELGVDATPEGGPGAEAPAPPGSPPTGRRIERLRFSLLAALSSLDRGLAANAREAAEVDELCSQMESLGTPITLSPSPPPAAGPVAGGGSAGVSGINDQLAGTWRLIYSSGFNSGSLGGRRPGPPAALFPTILGQVYQCIDPQTAKLDNIVELLFSYGPPDLGLLSGPGGEVLGRGLERLSQQLGVSKEQLPAPLKDLLLGPEKREQQQQQQGMEGGPAGKGTSWKRQGWGSPAARLTLRHDYEVIWGDGWGWLAISIYLYDRPLRPSPRLKGFMWGNYSTKLHVDRKQQCGPLTWNPSEAKEIRRGVRHVVVLSPATVRIVYEETYGELVGSGFFAQLPRLAAPSLPEPLRPPKFLRSATFEVTFLDEMMRITRGDRGELRVYLRDTAAEMALQGSAGGRFHGTGSGAEALDYDG
ncbi:hypothetical protein VOLCADRAFT_105590 [Volvox carteri f. nagariensis]|uniref:Plastid lipid-associated protein/fibrillin conserved domain-containing protein n=1 Tax=Volvox carteri f. nagariensis TaxID=3068 RepID=D8U1Q2_VOLCA|nr:uncharacterized protein VOLCADRAFT_105590 [Volvox carteri f. nagariensis]EFJ46380.1 hypothetical protein VOLCADRAFT_105590 [Volvox carteri f. nagariensis]|eukprot:XP_002952533.1 hypothetical protein VOLCADRAFT_105590 [Volvox carteri f. nagariensis]